MPLTPAPTEHERVTTVSFDPLGLMKDRYALSVARRASDHIAIRVDGQLFEAIPYFSNPERPWRVGISAPIYLDRTYHGPFIEPGIAVARRVGSLGQTPGTDDMPSTLYAVYDHAVGPEIYLGWQWLFRSGLQVAAAVGASQNWAGNDLPEGAVVAGGGYAIATTTMTYVRVGYAF
jgi:hypothetical protein